jgi:hypothetical protein
MLLKGEKDISAVELVGFTWLHYCERIILNVSETKENLIRQSKSGKFLLRASFYTGVIKG